MVWLPRAGVRPTGRAPALVRRRELRFFEHNGPVDWVVLESPIGELALAADGAGLCAVRFAAVAGALRTTPPSAPAAAPGPIDPATPADSADQTGPADPTGPTGPVAAAAAQLRAYFAGELTDFALPVSIRAGSDFERAVWAALRHIPYGQTRTYGQVAAAVGDPAAARAVGVACNRNPVPLVVPCHRVVGAGNRLVGFGGGLPRKRFLLELESRVSMQRAWAGLDGPTQAGGGQQVV